MTFLGFLVNCFIDIFIFDENIVGVFCLCFLIKGIKNMIKQIGLTLMELVIAIVVAIALGAGAIVLYQDLTGNAQSAAQSDLAGKVSTAIALYIANNEGVGDPTGDLISGSGGQKYIMNSYCTTSGGSAIMVDSGKTSINVYLTSSGGGHIAGCTDAAYGVSTN